MSVLKLSLFMIAGLLGGSPLLAQSPGHGANSGVEASELGLEPWQSAQVLDKARIAEESFQRLYGLEEAGNPHLKPGTILENVQLAASEPDLNTLRRDRALTTFASRTVNWSAPVEHSHGAAALPEADSGGHPDAPGGRQKLWIAGALLAAIIGWRCSVRGRSDRALSSGG